MDAGLISQGVIDSRPIQEIKPDEIKDYARCHFFAGIAGWDYALQLAGWPEDRPVWTASLPCQPFSVAGKRQGERDARHLWPVFYDLVKECRPVTIFGEQVPTAIKNGWWDCVATDLENVDYTTGAICLPAFIVGAWQERYRLFWVATNNRREREQGVIAEALSRQSTFPRGEDVRGVEDLRGRSDIPEPLVRRLNDGLRNGVAELHAYGNSIVPQVAAEFVRAFMEVSSNA